jgi:3-hydroxyacyl-CoA dehydrogenase, NAD binding domain
MTDTKPIRRIAIIGTGVIGASWTALFLAKGIQVVATDIAPNAEGGVCARSVLFRHLRGNGRQEGRHLRLPRETRAAVSRTLNFDRERDRTFAMATPSPTPVPTKRFLLTSSDGLCITCARWNSRGPARCCSDRPRDGRTHGALRRHRRCARCGGSHRLRQRSSRARPLGSLAIGRIWQGRL